VAPDELAPPVDVDAWGEGPDDGVDEPDPPDDPLLPDGLPAESPPADEAGLIWLNWLPPVSVASTVCGALLDGVSAAPEVVPSVVPDPPVSAATVLAAAAVALATDGAVVVGAVVSVGVVVVVVVAVVAAVVAL